MSRTRTILAVAALFVAGGCASRDMDNWCELATQIETDESVAAEDKVRVMLERFEPRSSDVKTVVEVLGVVEAGQRYELTEHAAREELGLDDWSCPALKRVLAAPEAAPSDPS